jgi:hypothetical protein
VVLSTCSTSAWIAKVSRRANPEPGRTRRLVLFGILKGSTDAEFRHINPVAFIDGLRGGGVRPRREGEVSEFLTLQQAADLAGAKVAQIRVRIEVSELTPKALGISVTTRETTYHLSFQ